MEKRMAKDILVAWVLVVTACGCGSSDVSECEAACTLIEAACMSTESDCVDDCSDDLDECPDEMSAVLDCVFTSVLQCDPEEDQGLAEAPCEQEHAAVKLCGADPF